ncbi:hypothetical protein LOTGIDRAFT_170560 [Lottia gigantea]|uniref:RBR-type E3 ubiquitin transferase n=1 Tax=Lottia gigantea TaxID=225164 RepID=V4AKJ8_LOTGI|nr:hypothetical protein LOTGIDRAFT_170560 [Lottia gigantea]ESP04724.1 hypothetical protein LOTGIDRAFT_170560 [Lottia gigantea]
MDRILPEFLKKLWRNHNNGDRDKADPEEGRDCTKIDIFDNVLFDPLPARTPSSDQQTNGSDIKNVAKSHDKIVIAETRNKYDWKILPYPKESTNKFKSDGRLTTPSKQSSFRQYDPSASSRYRPTLMSESPTELDRTERRREHRETLKDSYPNKQFDGQNIPIKPRSTLDNKAKPALSTNSFTKNEVGLPHQSRENRGTQNGSLSSRSFGSSDLSNDEEARLQHTREVLKRTTDKIRKSESKESKTCTDYPGIRLSSTSFGSCNISNDKVATLQHRRDVLKRDTGQIRKSDRKESTLCRPSAYPVVPKRNEFCDESKKNTKCPMTQYDHLSSTTRLSFESSDGTDVDTSKSRVNYIKMISPRPFIYRQSNSLENKTAKESGNGSSSTKVIDTYTKKIHDSRDGYQQFNMETSTVDTKYKGVATDKRTPTDKQPIVDKQPLVDKRPPVDKGNATDKRKPVDKQPVDQRTSANDSSEIDKYTKKNHSQLDKLLSDCVEKSRNDCLKKSGKLCDAENAGEHSLSTLEIGTLAKYHSQGARPKDSSFINKSKNMSPNLAETSGGRNDVKGLEPTSQHTKFDTRQEANDHSKRSKNNETLNLDQSKVKSANPDLTENSRRQSYVNRKSETNQKASHKIIAATASEQKGSTSLHERNNSLNQDQSKSKKKRNRRRRKSNNHEATKDNHHVTSATPLRQPEIGNSQPLERSQSSSQNQSRSNVVKNPKKPETTPINPTIIQDKPIPSKVHLTNHFQKIATCPKSKPSRSFYVVLLKIEMSVPLVALLDIILGPDSERTILSIEDEPILDLESATLNFSDVQKAEQALKQLREFNCQNLLCTWTTVDKRIEILKTYFNDFEFHSSDILKTHDEKIQAIRKQLESCAFDEKEALKMRKEELILQLREFTSFSKTVRESLRRSILLEDEQSPPDAAIQTAIETLEELGSIKDDRITDIGKWLVKIPLEPRFGCMIKKGFEMGFAYDTIVFTALCSSSGSIFYRGGNDQQKKRSDLKKLTFCDTKGDAFTYLKIYKEWEQVTEKRKNKWCFDNALNSKSLRGARELVNEICSIFKHNWSILVKKTFSTKVELEEALQNIILFAFYENIAHSLGHNRMGYYIPNLRQRVFVHPSSALNSLNDSSQWLVFINILKTSRDYITVVTPVEESWIRKITSLKTKQFDIDEAKRKSVCSVRNQFFGSTTYSFFVGPAHSKLKAYEDLLYESVQVPVVIEADRKTGEVKFICGFNVALPGDLIDNWIVEARSHVIQRTAEYKVGSNNQAGGVRIVLGLGGEGQLILMPDEYRNIHIKSSGKETSKETVVDKFKRFGQIVDCWEDKRSYHRWGRVTFSTPEAAAEAVRRTQDDPKHAATPEFKIQKHAFFQYQATIEWVRRKPTGLVFVDMDYLEAMSVKSLREVRILGQSCSISLDKKKRGTVLLRKVPTMVTEQDIQYCFPQHSQRRAITKISIIREKTFTNPNEIPYFQQQIHDQFQEFDHDMKFVVDVMKPYDSNINFRAFIKFNDASQGTMACDALRGRLIINGQKANLTPKLSSSLSVSEQVYQLLEDEIEDFTAELRENGTEFKLDSKKLKNERRVFNISASNSNDLVQIRLGLAAIVQGEVIEYWSNENNRYLFLKSGREFLRSLEKRTNTILQVDNRLLSLRVFGLEDNILMAQNAIDQYLGNMVEGDGRREIKLDGKSQPKGLMKTLVTRYDLELEGFVQASGLQSALLNHHNQTLKISGDSASIEKATGLIESLATELRNKITKTKIAELPDCCTCLCPVQSMDYIYRLEACGHVYCLDCIKRQITVAVQSKELPVLCGNCQDPLVWSDFEFCFKRLQINPLDLVRTAVSVYMIRNKDGYRHCPTPDCPMVYRITKKSDVFNCNECGMRICTSCHVEYHDGLTCAMLKSSSDVDSDMEKYLRENATRVKRCPKCSTPIEKKSGCNHMTCSGCKIHFCWLCCQAFTTTSSVYGHLNAQHGGIFDFR